MTVTQPITESLIRECIVKGVQDVFKTMLKRDAVVRPPGGAPSRFPGFHILGNVGFVGDANGVVYLCFSDKFASFAASEMLGMSLGEVNMHGFDVVKDVIGEIANMTVGGFKNQICDIGYPCKLTLPTIVRGQDLSVSAISGTQRFAYEFDCAGHVLTADIQLQTEKKLA